MLGFALLCALPFCKTMRLSSQIPPHLTFKYYSRVQAQTSSRNKGGGVSDIFYWTNCISGKNVRQALGHKVCFLRLLEMYFLVLNTFPQMDLDSIEMHVLLHSGTPVHP